MELVELENLYNEQAYTEVITHLDSWLQEHPDNISGWQLLGLSLLEEAKLTSNLDLANTAFLSAYGAFSKVLDLDPTHLKARLNRAWIGAHEISDKEDETLADCEAIVGSGDAVSSTTALLYSFHVHRQLEETELALADMLKYLEIVNTHYSTDLPQLNSAKFECFIRIGDLYISNDNAPLALIYYKQAIGCNPFPKRLLSIAHLAFEQKDYEFLESLIDTLLYTNESGDDYMLLLLKDIKKRLETGERSLPLYKTFCKGSLIYWRHLFSEDPEESALQQISMGKELLLQYPEEDYFFSYYIATALFNVESYEEARKWYNRCMNGDQLPSCFIRWYYSCCQVNGEWPEYWPASNEGSAFEWYLAAMTFSELVSNEANEAVHKAKKFLYKQAFDRYYNYWNKNTGEPTAGNLLHYAMCCNNYGIALNEAGVYVEAVLVHTIGFNIHPFWEQLESRADAYHNMGKLAAAVSDRKRILQEYSKELPLIYYVSIYERLIEDLCALEEFTSALALHEKVLDDYQQKIIPQLNQLSVFERERIGLSIDRIKTGRAFIRSDRSNDLSERIKALEDHLSEKPDDSDAYFNLMYLYFDNQQYEHCVGAVNNRISIGGIPQLPVISQMKIYYFRGKALLKLRRYQEAITDMLHTLTIMQRGDIIANSPSYSVSIYTHLAEAYMGVKEYNSCLAYCIQSLNIYTANNWAWDSEVSGIRYLMALAFEGKGDLYTCRKMIDLIITYDPGYKPAIEKRKQWGISEKLISGFRNLVAKIKSLKN